MFPSEQSILATNTFTIIHQSIPLQPPRLSAYSPANKQTCHPHACRHTHAPRRPYLNISSSHLRQKHSRGPVAPSRYLNAITPLLGSTSSSLIPSPRITYRLRTRQRLVWFQTPMSCIRSSGTDMSFGIARAGQSRCPVLRDL